MKGSDSTNSLTELTGKDECFICLANENDKGEPLVSSKLLRTCGCKFFVHPECWNQWIQGKSDYDCPICRKQSIVRIHVPPNPIFYAEGFEEARRERPSRKYVAACIVLGIGIFALAIILSLIYR